MYKNTEGENCIMICDVKNHLIRSANLVTKQVETISGKSGFRGSDYIGGVKDMN